MAIERVMLWGQMIAIDPETGRLGVTTDAAVDIGDVGVLNAAGEKVNPAEQFSYLAGPDEISIDDTATGRTLAAMLSAALETGLRRLTLIIQSAGASWAAGSATAGTNELPAGVYELNVTKAQADTLKFITATGTVKASVLQEG